MMHNDHMMAKAALINGYDWLCTEKYNSCKMIFHNKCTIFCSIPISWLHIVNIHVHLEVYYFASEDAA